MSAPSTLLMWVGVECSVQRRLATAYSISVNVNDGSNPFENSRITVFVTVYGKTRHMGFFVKIEFDASISSTIELTCIQVLDRSRSLL